MEDHAERIVNEAVKQGAQDAVAEVIADRNYQIRFAQNEPVIVNQWRKDTGNLFLAYNKRVVSGEITNFDRIPEAVGTLIKVARASQENPDYRGIAKGPFKYARPTPDKKILSLDDGSDYVEAAVNGALEEGAKECAGSFWRYNDAHYLHTSNGASGFDHRAGVYLSIRALLSLESSGHGVSCATKLSQFNPESAGHKAGKIAKLAKNPKGGAPGKYDIVFDPLILGSLIDQVGHRASAYYVETGFSPYGKKVGKKIASDAVTIVDDGSADSLARRKFDEEGVPTRKKAIVQKGVLKTYLHNTSTAKKYKTKTTGNAGLVAPEPHALWLQPGDWTRDELFEEVKDGLWLTNTWYTRFQSYVTGDFSTIPRDGIFRIKDGEVAGALKDIRLSDNLLNVWKSIKGISKKAEQVTWWGEVDVPTFAPYALATKIGITKSAM
ncbi:MAG TPA: TldD/PmbA family protein [Thermoplasmata archaeon]|nr:TldD/PmbA family protein [Thermoplasmata archaeon]